MRDYVNVCDLALVHLGALKELQKRGLLVSNVGSGRGYSELGVWSVRSKRNLEENCVELRIDDVAGDPARLVADAQFFRSWYPGRMMNLEDTVGGMI